VNEEFYCLFFDCLHPIAAKFGLPRSAHVGVLVAPARNMLERLPATAPESLRAELDTAARCGRPYGITLGCVLSRAVIDCVLDLRRRDAQQWFFSEYVPAGPFPTNANDFIGILPELLQPALGGSVGGNFRLQHIGANLRSRGVAALIYPSARADVAVHYDEDMVAHWRGWNMVRYRGKGVPRPNTHHEDPGGWETRFWNGIRTEVDRLPSGEITGWKIVGLEAVNMFRYDFAVKKRGLSPKTILTSNKPKGSLGKLVSSLFGR
jgi:hypothetical protein